MHREVQQFAKVTHPGSSRAKIWKQVYLQSAPNALGMREALETWHWNSWLSQKGVSTVYS